LDASPFGKTFSVRTDGIDRSKGEGVQAQTPGVEQGQEMEESEEAEGAEGAEGEQQEGEEGEGAEYDAAELLEAVDRLGEVVQP
jgi:hypothetical protein